MDDSNKYVRYGMPWTDEEYEALRTLWRDVIKGRRTVIGICEKMMRPPAGVTSKLVQLNLIERDQEDIVLRYARSEIGASMFYQLMNIFPQRRNPVATTPKESTVTTPNFHHMLTLLQEGYTTVAVVFDDQGLRSKKYTYKVPLTANIQMGDAVVVEGDGILAIAKVDCVHDKPQIDVKAPYAFKWIVCKVDRAAYDDQMAREAQAIEMLEAAERARAKQDALAELMKHVPDPAALKLLLNGGAK